MCVVVVVVGGCVCCVCVCVVCVCVCKAAIQQMGWRSWNAYRSDVDQQKMMAVMDKMVEAFFSVDKYQGFQGTIRVLS